VLYKLVYGENTLKLGVTHIFIMDRFLFPNTLYAFFIEKAIYLE